MYNQITEAEYRLIYNSTDLVIISSIHSFSKDMRYATLDVEHGVEGSEAPTCKTESKTDAIGTTTKYFVYSMIK